MVHNNKKKPLYRGYNMLDVALKQSTILNHDVQAYLTDILEHT